MRQLIATACAACLVAGAGLAQEAEGPRRVDSFGDWAVFITANPFECFATALASDEYGWPEDAAASQGARILVTFRSSFSGPAPATGFGQPVDPTLPGETDDPVETRGEVSFWSGGRSITPGTALGLRAGSAQFPLFSDGEWAWPPSAQADQAMIDGLTAAAQAEISLLTAGTVPVTITFSLDGFGAAVARAHDFCTDRSLSAEPA